MADEPSGNLDIETGRKLHELLFELNQKKGTTFLIATHNRELAAQCHRELEIVDGKAVERNRRQG
jgi:predicted ABC-type transport system involved in lysophospholipase L1 biosynthesis ATPase subunit